MLAIRTWLLPSALNLALVMGEQVCGLPTRMSWSSVAAGQSQSLSSLGRSGCGVCPQGSVLGLWGTTYPQLVSRRLSPTCRDAMPKSAIRMLFLSSSSRFSGFKSLWLGSKGQMSLNVALHPLPHSNSLMGTAPLSKLLLVGQAGGN